MDNNHKWRLFERIVADFMSSSKTKGKTGKEVIHQRLLDITQGRCIVLTNNKKPFPLRKGFALDPSGT